MSASAETANVSQSVLAKKSKKRPHRSNAKQVNKAKQVQLLQKQQQQESPAAGAAAKAGRNKHAKSKSSQAPVPSASKGGGHASGGHAPTGSGPPAHPWDPKRDLPTRGLLNLGNTCFFNSALQNVFKARLLHEALFADGSGRREGEYIGPLTKAFRKVLLEMAGEGPVGGRRGAYSPKALLSAIQRAHPSFRGYHQQDAHELFMRLVGTLEDEEDSSIKKRRQEEKEAQDAKREHQDVNDSGGGMGSEGGEAPPADTKAGSSLFSTQAAQKTALLSSGGDRKQSSDDRSGNVDTTASNIAEERVGGALAGKDDALAMPVTEKEGPDVEMSDHMAERPATPDSRSPPGASPEVPAPADGDEEETSEGRDDGVATSPDSSTETPCDRGKAELSNTSGEACARNGVGNGNTPDGSSDDAGAESTEEAAGAIGEDAEVVVAGADRLPIECSSANEKEMITTDSQQCGGGGGANADADTSTDDGETTDAGDDDDDDDDDDDVDGAAINSPSQPSHGSLAEVEPTGTDVAAVGVEKEEDQGERKDIVAVVAPAVPQRAAVTEVFGGTMCSVVTCSSCGGRSFSTEPTICLSLEIPMKPKALSKTALAFIAQKKAAAAAKAAAAGAEAASAESGTTMADSTCAAESQPSPASSGGKGNEGVTEPALGEKAADEIEGFQLSAKEKRKVARQEQRLMKAKAKAEEDASVYAAGSPGPESDGSRPATAKPPTEGAEGASQTPPDGDEVRQCLEYVLSVCIADADAGEDSGGVAGQGSEAVAAEEEADASGIGTGEQAANAPEALLPGFELSAQERKKITRQDKFERRREAWAAEGGKDVPQKSDDRRDSVGASKQTTSCATVHLEPEEGAARSTADVETPAQQSAEKPSAGGEDEQQGAAVDESGKCSGGDGGAGSGGEKDGCGSTVSTASTDPTSPVAEVPPASSDRGPEEHSQAQRPTNRNTGTCERPDCDGRKCGGGPPASEDVIAGAEASGQVRQPEATETVAQGARDGPQDRIETGNDPGGLRTLDSSGSLAGCTTGKTHGSTDLRGDLGSAFGSECSEGHKNEERAEDSATAPDSALKCPLDSSAKPGIEVDKGPGGQVPAVDFPPTGVEEDNAGAESKVVGSERGQESPLPSGGVLAVNENGHVMPTANGSTSDCHVDELGGAPAAARKEEEEVTASSPSAASQSPLNRLEEPPARVKPDRRHDADGINLYGCLDHFMAEEKLVAGDGNGYDCEGCSSRTRPSEDEDSDDRGAKAKPVAPRRQQNAKKRLLMLGQPPGVLVCHLKRLQAKRKIIRSVEFPIDLDMAPYFWRDPKAPLSPQQTCYRLTGLIQHRGSRLGGHYVAYVRDKDGWKHASDSAIRTATLPELKACEAYMLFYEQTGSTDVKGDESDVNGVAPGSPDGSVVVDETNEDEDSDAAESSGAALSSGDTTAGDTTATAAEAVEGGQEEKQDDEEGEDAPPEEQAEEKGEGVTSGATEAQEEKSAVEEGGAEVQLSGEIWI